MLTLFCKRNPWIGLIYHKSESHLNKYYLNIFLKSYNFFECTHKNKMRTLKKRSDGLYKRPSVFCIVFY